MTEAPEEEEAVLPTAMLKEERRGGGRERCRGDEQSTQWDEYDGQGNNAVVVQRRCDHVVVCM